MLPITGIQRCTIQKTLKHRKINNIYEMSRFIHHIHFPGLNFDHMESDCCSLEQHLAFFVQFSLRPNVTWHLVACVLLSLRYSGFVRVADLKKKLKNPFHNEKKKVTEKPFS